MGTDPDRNAYQTLLRSRVKGAVASARAATGITHQGLKGEVLEILISDLFVPLLPTDVGIGTGQIVECKRGILSNQTDIILYDKSILPPLLFDRRQGIFPIEAVLYAIEVKTTLTKAELEKSHVHAKTLNNCRYIIAEDKQGSACIERVRSVVFALNTDLRAQDRSEIHRYRDIYGDDHPYIRAICVVDRGYWYDDGGKWLNFRTVGEFGEVLAFIGGVTNTYGSIARSRGTPMLGNYIIPNDVIAMSVMATRPGEAVVAHVETEVASNLQLGVRPIGRDVSNDPQ
jgi:hypothetical protein